ncbi:MAG: potassium channel protein [Ignavibacteria bacterium]|nr:potassium channel protein [Ignavibacteria bacterium]
MKGYYKYGFSHFKRILIIIIMLLSSVSIGVSGYILIEGYTFIEAFYMTVITISTAGFMEVRPLTDAGRVFTSFLLITSIGIFFYGVTAIAALLIEGEFRNVFKNYKVKKKIENLNSHVIVCGYGRNGKQVCLELEDDRQPYVIIEKRDEIVAELKENPALLFIEGDATEEEVLIDAGIRRAKAIITTLPEDPDNVYVTLSSRELNPDIIIISRASNESSVTKLKRAGATNVIMPEKIGGAHMAALVMKPDIMEFIAQLTGQASDISLTFEEFSLNDISDEYAGKTIKDFDIRNKTGANIIGLRLADGTYMINPLPDTVITTNTKLIVLGNRQQITDMKKLIDAL